MQRIKVYGHEKRAYIDVQRRTSRQFHYTFKEDPESPMYDKINRHWDCQTIEPPSERDTMYNFLFKVEEQFKYSDRNENYRLN